MNAPKEKAASYDGQSRLPGPTFTPTTVGPQRGISDEILRRWFNEGERLSRLYQLTGKSRHLQAFCLHISAALTEVAATLP